MTLPAHHNHGRPPHARESAARRITTAPFLFVIFLYRITLSPFVGRHCRFTPTCSRYAEEAYREHGVLRGSWLTLRRLARCHPFGGKGYDPVPLSPSASHNPRRT